MAAVVLQLESCHSSSSLPPPIAYTLTLSSRADDVIWWRKPNNDVSEESVDRVTMSGDCIIKPGHAGSVRRECAAESLHSHCSHWPDANDTDHERFIIHRREDF